MMTMEVLEAIRMFQEDLRSPHYEIEEGPPIKPRDMSSYQNMLQMKASQVLFCVIVILMIIFAPFLRPNCRQNTQNHMQKTSDYENQTQTLIIICAYIKHYVFTKLELKFQQCTLTVQEWLQFIYTMIIKSRSTTSFKLYSYALLHNQYIKILNYSIITLLKTQQIKSSQKIQQLKLQFIKNDNIIYSKNNKSIIQSRQLNSLEAMREANFECLKLITLIIKAMLIKTRFLRYNQFNLVFLLLITNASGSPQCNSFPKIFGGSKGNSFLHQIDVFDHYLVIAGHTHDHWLLGSNPAKPIPIIALSSISSINQFIWAKAFAQKQQMSFDGVQFSGDGNLLIAHSGYSLYNIIVVIEVSNANVLSARKYSYYYPYSDTFELYRYNDRFKSILVSNGPSPMAFVLSDYQTFSSLFSVKYQFIDFGKIIFKIDPLMFSQPIWARKFIQYQGKNGLEFGRSQQFLYTFSQKGQSTIELLDTNGASFWQYSTPHGNYYNNLIKYKEIDSTTDMVIATSSSTNIFYHRIISTSTSPYAVSLTQTFKDPSSITTKQLYGLYIIDQDNAVSLIQDTSNLNVDVATINFQSSSISFQRAFPQIQNLVIAVFTSPTVYYAGGYGRIFQSGLDNPPSFNSEDQMFVYSSEPSQNPCYQMAPVVAASPLTMELLADMNKVSEIFSQVYPLRFINDTNAHTPVDINQSKMTQFPYSQCPLIRINAVTQAKTPFRFEENSGDQTLAITPFSATAFCGASNTWTYTGKNNSNGQALVYTTDLMNVDPNTGTIFVSQSKPAGNYVVKVIGTLPDLTTTNQVFTIIINGPPVFSSPPKDITIPLKSYVPYIFSSITDPNSGDIPTISEVKDSATGSLPSFITFNPVLSLLAIYPTVMTDVKTYQMIVSITDSYVTKQYTFFLTVTNKAPILTSTIIPLNTITFGQTTIYLLPMSQDPEGLPYWTSINSGPSYASLFSQTQLKLEPKICADFGSQTVEIKLQDEEPAITTYLINFEVKNIDPPVFTVQLPQNQNAILNKKTKYQLPPIRDPNGCSVKIQLDVQPIASFISLHETELLYEPTQSYHLGAFQITINLIGIQNIQSQSSFQLTVYEPPKFYKSLQKQLDLKVMNSQKFYLPVLDNIPDEKVVHPSGLPNFVQFNFPVYTFYPERENQVGMFTIKGELWNSFTNTEFCFRVSVTNQAPYLRTSKIPDFDVPFDTDYTFYFGEGTDREGQKIRYESNEKSKSTLPSFITLEASQRKFKISPSKLVPRKDYHIELNLIDEFNARTTYPFVVNVIDPSNQIKGKIKKPFSIDKSYLSAKIKSISPYGVVVIKFDEELDTPIFINNASLKFNSSNIDVRLKPFVDQNEKNKNKSIARWDAINLTTNELTITINFTDPALISPKITQEDNIEIIFSDGELFKSAKGQKNLPDDYVLLTGLPRQIVLTRQIATLYDMVTSGSKTMTYLVIGNIALQLFLSFSMHLLWGMMNNLQLITTMLKFNINVPSNAYIFFKYIDEFLSMKPQFIENYLDKFNSYIIKTTQTGGLSDKDAKSSIIKNLGTIILGSVAIVLAMIITALLIKYSRISIVMKITDALKNKLFYNSILRTGVQSYLKFSIIAFASLDSYKDKTTLATGIFFLCLTIFFILFAHFFLRRNQAVLSDPSFQLRFNSLYLNIDTNTAHSCLLTTIFLGRRFLLGLILSFCDNHQDVQFFYMNSTSFMIIIYLIKVRPLISNYLNTIEIFNEVILYGCTGLIWGMTDYQSEMPTGESEDQIKTAYDSKQNQIGWAYIIMASLTIAATVGGLIVNLMVTIKNKIIQKYGINNKAVKAPEPEPLSPERRDDYKLQQYDETTMIQNHSMLQDLNLEVRQEPVNNVMPNLEDPNHPFQSQDHHNKQFQKEMLEDPYLDNLPDHYNLDSQQIRKDNSYDQNNEEIKKQAVLMKPFNEFKEALSPQPQLIEEEQRIYTESVFVSSSSEFQSSLEESKEVYPVECPPQLHQPPDLPDVFISSEEVQNIFQESSSVVPNDLWEGNDSHLRRQVQIKKFNS